MRKLHNPRISKFVLSAQYCYKKLERPRNMSQETNGRNTTCKTNFGGKPHFQDANINGTIVRILINL